MSGEVEKLRADLAESEAENDQWQKKLEQTWVELAEERAAREELADLSITQQLEIEQLRGEIGARIERLEAITVLLCEQSAQGQGHLRSAPLQRFIDDWRREHRG